MLDALRAVGAGIDRYRQTVAARLDLGSAELITIGQLHHQEPMRAAQIGSRTGLTPGSVTALLDRLEARGYIRRTTPEHDRRGRQIYLTTTGRALGDGIVAPLVPALDSIADDIGSNGSQTVITVLNMITEVLADLAADRPTPTSVDRETDDHASRSATAPDSSDS
jgi:DNA-binding MarR family transcriptional regulator